MSLAKARRLDAGKLRDCGDVDIKDVEKQPAVRRIGAGLPGPVGKQRVQRVEADGGGAGGGGNTDQPLQIPEVAMAPIHARPQRIKLSSNAPNPSSVALESAHHGRIVFLDR